MVVSMSLSISVVSASFQFSSGGVQTSVHRDHRGTRGGVGMRNMPFLYLSQDSGTNTNEGGGGGLMLSTLSKSSLVESAFAALSDEDQYDAVLTGLCAKLLDNPLEGDNDTPLEDPIQLLQEMNARNIIASPRSTMALIDVRVFLYIHTLFHHDLILMCMHSFLLEKISQTQCLLTIIVFRINGSILWILGGRNHFIYLGILL
jgi:hypothetical protein